MLALALLALGLVALATARPARRAAARLAGRLDDGGRPAPLPAPPAGDAPAGAGPAEAAPDGGAPRLVFGRSYTRTEIHAMLGGGMSDYLPHVGGRVVCGCFHPGLHPYAPFVVLPGFRPGVQRWAEVLASQDAPIPCFLKRAARAWEYVGDFRIVDVSRAPDEIAEWELIAEREGDVSMVLHMEEVRGRPRRPRRRPRAGRPATAAPS